MAMRANLLTILGRGAAQRESKVLWQLPRRFCGLRSGGKHDRPKPYAGITLFTSPHGETILSSSIDELTVNYEENGTLVCKELDKVILSRGLWSTIIFRYQEWRVQENDYGPDKYVIRRYKKVGEEYKAQSKFSISSPKQARQLIDVLTSWLPKE